MNSLKEEVNIIRHYNNHKTPILLNYKRTPTTLEAHITLCLNKDTPLPETLATLGGVTQYPTHDDIGNHILRETGVRASSLNSFAMRRGYYKFLIIHSLDLSQRSKSRAGRRRGRIIFIIPTNPRSIWSGRYHGCCTETEFRKRVGRIVEKLKAMVEGEQRG